MSVSIREKIKGAFDLAFLFGRGIEPFEKDNSKSAGLKSLWVPAILFPINAASAWFFPPEDLQKVAKPQIMLTMTGQTIISTIVAALILWLASIALDRRDRFWIAFQAANWVNIPLNIIAFPFLLLAIGGWYPRDKMDNIFTVLLCYNFLISACVNYRGLKINWELAGFLACFGYVIGKAIQDIGDWFNGVPPL